MHGGGSRGVLKGVLRNARNLRAAEARQNRQLLPVRRHPVGDVRRHGHLSARHEVGQQGAALAKIGLPAAALDARRVGAQILRRAQHIRQRPLFDNGGRFGNHGSAAAENVPHLLTPRLDCSQFLRAGLQLGQFRVERVQLLHVGVRNGTADFRAARLNLRGVHRADFAFPVLGQRHGRGGCRIRFGYSYARIGFRFTHS